MFAVTSDHLVDEESFPLLVWALEDDDDRVRCHALQALAGRQEEGGLVRAGRNDPPQDRAEAARQGPPLGFTRSQVSPSAFHGSVNAVVRRRFGAPPGKDTARLREAALSME
jgi:hypothetical protein